MKKLLFAVVTMVCVSSAVNAQVAPDKLPNRFQDLKLNKLLIDSSLTKLTLPPNALTPGNYFKADKYPAQYFGSLTDVNTNMVMSAMPVKSLHSDDKMGIAILNNNTQPMLIKRIVVVKP